MTKYIVYKVRKRGLLRKSNREEGRKGGREGREKIKE